MHPPTEYSSRIPGFYRLSLAQRIERVAALGGRPIEALQKLLATGGLSAEAADKIVENVVGVYALPLGLALNVQINGHDRLAPMVVEEPSVIAAASNAAKMVRAGGGFEASVPESLMTAQVQVYDVSDAASAQARIQASQTELLAQASAAVPNLLRRGGGPRHLEVRQLGDGQLVVHLHIDCCDAMGANLVNTIAEAVGPRVAALAGGRLGLRILTNLCDRRRVVVRARIPFAALAQDGSTDSGAKVAAGIEAASRFAEADPYRAATHNKGIMNGIDSVVIATGNDYRAVEAGAHAYACRGGVYRPLAVWRTVADGLEGHLELPLALGVVGGTLKVHPTAQLALELSGVKSAGELAELAASVGLASNLAALRALAGEGIQKGHMGLHARSIAVAAGALGDEVEQVASQLTQNPKALDQRTAEAILLRLRQGTR